MIPWLVFDILLSWYQYQPYLSRTGIGSLECPPVISRFYWLLRIWDILRILKIFFDVLFINSKKRVKHTHTNIKIWRVLWIHAMFSFSFIYTEGILRKEKSSRFSSPMQGKNIFLSLKLIQFVGNCVYWNRIDFSMIGKRFNQNRHFAFLGRIKEYYVNLNSSVYLVLTPFSLQS